MDISKLADESEGLKGYSKDSLQIVRELRPLLERFAALELDRVLRRDLGDLSLESARDRAIEFIRVVGEIPLNLLGRSPVRLLEGVLRAAKEMEQLLDRVETFSLKGGTAGRNPAGESDYLAQQLTELGPKFVDATLPMLGYLAARTLVDTSVVDPVAAIRSLRDAKLNADRLVGEIKEMAKASAELTRDMGLESNARYFNSQAREHSRWSWGWLVATAVVASGTLLWAWQNYQEALVRALPTSAGTSAPSLSATAVAQLGIAKLLLFSVLLGATFWCARNYRAHRHNYVVNRHRRNALASFEAFVSSTKDPQVKNAVLVQATASIFAPQSTGYGGADGEASGGTPLIEMVRTIAEPPKT